MKDIVTVVTVSYNAEKTIERTINSVLSQTYAANIQYLIIDGKSNDGTCNIVKNYISNTPNSHIELISEPDTGVYNAMNKAINLAQGKWIIFMNADDYFVNSQVVEKFVELGENADVVYGDTVCNDNGLYRISCAKNIRLIKYRKPFVHQSVFVKTSVHKKFMFNDKDYKISADYDVFLRMFKQKVKFKYINMIVSVFSTEGISSINTNQGEIEDYLVQKSNGVNYFSTPLLFLYRIKNKKRLYLK